MADDAFRTTLSVVSATPPIADAQIGSLFDAFQPELDGNDRNPAVSG